MGENSKTRFDPKCTAEGQNKRHKAVLELQFFPSFGLVSSVFKSISVRKTEQKPRTIRWLEYIMEDGDASDFPIK